MNGVILIREILTYLSAKTTKEARIFGHLYESISLLEREKRCQSFWLPHRTQCKNFILKSCELAKSNEAVLVLGSGPLHEIPLEELAQKFKRVDLIDVVHLSETKDKFRHLLNVHFIEADVTELESEIRQNKKITNRVPATFLNQNYGLVISANLLSQLSYHLRTYLEKKASPKLSEADLDNFCYQVSLDHYKYITSFSCPVVLITDVESNFVGKNEEIIEVQTPYINFPLPTPQDEWWWNLAPRPEFSKEFSVKMKVSAFILNF